MRLRVTRACDACDGVAMTPSKYEFDQLVAEAVFRVGDQIVFNYLCAAGRRYGWPIPQHHRRQVIIGLALLVRMSL